MLVYSIALPCHPNGVLGLLSSDAVPGDHPYFLRNLAHMGLVYSMQG